MKKKDINLFSKKFRLNYLYKIVDKKGKLVTFKLNLAQELLRALELKLKKLFGTAWVNILKARQLGISTYKLIDGLDIVLFYENRTVLIVAHKQDKLKDLFQKVKLAYENIPDQISTSKGIWVKPQAKYDNVNEYYFPTTNSRIKVTLDARSGTATDLHISELAFRNDAEEMMRGTIPAAENANVTIESTAKGIATYYYNLWKKGETKQSRFVNFFLPWYKDIEYKKDLVEEKIIVLPDELKHLESLDLSNEQLNWYLERYNDDPNGTLQEYPTTPDEAFISTGRPVFNGGIVKAMIEKEYKQDAKFPDLYIFGKPETFHGLGVDVAEGLERGDFSTIAVLNENAELLAAYRGHTPPDELPKVIDRIYELGYKNNMVGIERNNHGLTTITKCRDYNWYSELYNEKTVDKITNKNMRKPGFLTTSKSKPLIIDRLEEYVRKGMITINDPRLKQEMFTYYYDEQGRTNAIAPNHDDLIMATAIGLYMITQPKNFVFA